MERYVLLSDLPFPPLPLFTPGRFPGVGGIKRRLMWVSAEMVEAEEQRQKERKEAQSARQRAAKKETKETKGKKEKENEE